MLSIQKKFLFIHVPKTGGNSIQNIISQYSDDRITTERRYQDGVERFDVTNDTYNVNKHTTLSKYKNVLDRKIYTSLFKFAVIRNPWDKMISHYFSPHRAVSQWDRSSFLELVERVPPIRVYICERSTWERVSTRVGLKPKRSNEPLDAYIDMLLKFEDLEDDFRKLCIRLDIPYSPLPTRNRSVRKHYSLYYDEDLIEIVRNKFIEEIEFGEYEFEYAPVNAS